MTLGNAPRQLRYIGQVVEEAPVVDARGLLCPLPIIRTAHRIKDVSPGATLILLSDDAGILEDLPAWCRSNGHELVRIEREGRVYRAEVRRGLRDLV